MGRSPGGGHGNPLQHSCLENPWTEEPGRLQSLGLHSQTRLKQFSRVQPSGRRQAAPMTHVLDPAFSTTPVVHILPGDLVVMGQVLS